MDRTTTDAIIDLSTIPFIPKMTRVSPSLRTHHPTQIYIFNGPGHKNATGNGGLPKVDFLYNHDVLKNA